MNSSEIGRVADDGGYMSSTVVSLAYGLAAMLALAALYFFHARAWYWHVASIVAALAIGLMPPPPNWSGPGLDLVTGMVLVFLLSWGVLGPIFRVTLGGKHKHA